MGDARPAVFLDYDGTLARRFGAPLQHGLALRTAGELAGGDRGIELLREAVVVLASSEGRLEHACALASLGADPRAGGTRQALAALLIAQRSCISERTSLVNQLQSLHTTAPVALRERIGPGNGRKLAARLVKMRARTDAPQSEQLIFTVLRDLARRAQGLAAQADAYKHELTELISSLDATLLDEYGVAVVWLGAYAGAPQAAAAPAARGVGARGTRLRSRLGS